MKIDSQPKISELEQSLRDRDIGCIDAADKVFQGICNSTGLGRDEYLIAKENRALASHSNLVDFNDQMQSCVLRYDQLFGFGSSARIILNAFEEQLEIDCSRLGENVEPHTNSGIERAIEAAALAHGVLKGEQGFKNYKPILIAPITDVSSLVATLYWPGGNPTATGSGLDWQFFLFNGPAAQAQSSDNLNPPISQRLHCAGNLLVGYKCALRHRSIQQVRIYTEITCMLMLWIAERLASDRKHLT